MTKDEAIELAKECGFSLKFYAAQFSGVLECEIADFQIVDLLNAAIAKEREACAILATDEACIVEGSGYYDQLGDARATAENIADSIRARGNK